VPGVELTVSKGAVDRAGTLLRLIDNGDEPPSRRDISAAIDTASHWRDCHAYPMRKASRGLASMSKTSLGRMVPVTQRLKRLPTIIDKLGREPKMSLSRMQDIAGCRAVLESTEEVYAVAEQIRRNGRVSHEKNYIENPKVTGYRSLHIVVRYDERLVEIQLRSRWMAEYATFVESVGGLLDQDLKSGIGDSAVLDFLAMAADGMDMEDKGIEPKAAWVDEFASLQTRAIQAVRQGHRQ